MFDLGSGDGRIPIAAAKRYGAFGVGVEIDAKLNREAADNASKAGVSDRVRFVTQDLFEADISQATVVTLFLLPRINQELIPEVRRELRPGTRIVSHQFDMGEQWPPEKSQDVNGRDLPLDDPLNRLRSGPGLLWRLGRLRVSRCQRAPG